MKNILLLAMSAISNNLSPKEFYIRGNELPAVKDCVGQLEPSVKLELQTNPGKDLEIVMLCTRITTEQKVNVGGNNEPQTAVEFFRKRVQEFPGGDRVTFKEIALDETDPIAGIHDVVKYIRDQKPIDRLSIDTHGGLRDVMLAMEAIVSLLKAENIRPDKIYGIQYHERESADQKNYILDQRDTFDLFDFVAGMNEFIKYGSVALLQQYYENRTTTTVEKDLLAAMKKVSDGAQESDPEKYKRGLDELGRQIKRIEEGDKLLQIFKDYVESGYGDLLDPKKRSDLGIIKHCLDKGLNQQALTFIETLMPSEFVRHGIIQFDAEEAARKKQNASKETIRKKDTNNAVVDGYIYNINRRGGRESGEQNLINRLKNGSYRAGRPLLDGKSEETLYIQSKKQEKQGNQEKQVKKDSEKKKRDMDTSITITSVISPKSKNRYNAEKLMEMHQALKECRNKTVHCDSERPPIEDIKLLMNAYVKLAGELFAKY